MSLTSRIDRQNSKNICVEEYMSSLTPSKWCCWEKAFHIQRSLKDSTSSLFLK